MTSQLVVLEKDHLATDLAGMKACSLACVSCVIPASFRSIAPEIFLTTTRVDEILASFMGDHNEPIYWLKP